MAIASIVANKMRALLTMLGIIIGIGSVIAIRTVGNSVTETFSDSMSSMGATNISVGVTQRETETVKGGESGLEFRGRRDRKVPEEKDYITDEMIADFKQEFAKEIEYILLSESLGSGRITVVMSAETALRYLLPAVTRDILRDRILNLLQDVR